MLCYLYLTFSLPVRFVLSIAKPVKKTKLAVDFESSEDLYESIRKSYQGIHVTKLFKRPPPPPSYVDAWFTYIYLSFNLKCIRSWLNCFESVKTNVLLLRDKIYIFHKIFFLSFQKL